MSSLPSSSHPSPAPPRLLAITDGAAEEMPSSLDTWLDGLAAAGVDTLQVREKHLDDRALLELVERVRRRLPAAVRVLVNGRLDVALAAGADGVHLPATGLPATPLRRLAEGLGRPGLLFGRSTHDLDEVRAARDERVDYATFGPVWPTPSKDGLGEPPGLGGLAEAARCGLPLVALGGVAPERVALATAAGARGVAAIRAFRRPGGAAGMVRALDAAAPTSRTANPGGRSRSKPC